MQAWHHHQHEGFLLGYSPQAGYGTVEIRVCDTPLTIENAALPGCYAQLLARWLLSERAFEIDEQFYLLYQHKRFEAGRYGLDGHISQQASDKNSTPVRLSIFVNLLETLHELQRFAQIDAEILAFNRLRHMAHEPTSDADWMRKTYKQRNCLNDVMRLSSTLWMKSEPSFKFH